MHLGKKKLKELKDNKISIEDLNDLYFINSQNTIEVDNILKLLNENICSFQQIVDKFKNIKDDWNKPCLYLLLDKKELFEELISNNRLNRHALRHVFITDVLKTYSCMDTEDLKYLLNKIDNRDELDNLCKNTSLIKCILNEFILDVESTKKFRRLLESGGFFDVYNVFKNPDEESLKLRTIFDVIAYWNHDNAEILRLNEVNQIKVYPLVWNFDFNKEQKLELVEALKNNEIAQNRLLQIVDNRLSNSFSFDSLMQHLCKKERKSLMNI